MVSLLLLHLVLLSGRGFADEIFIVGIYSLTWVFQCLYHTLPIKERKPPTVMAQMHKYPKTGVDESTSILLSFPSGPGGATYAQGVATTSLRIGIHPDSKEAAAPAIRIQGTKAEIQVDHPAYRPKRWRLVHKDGQVEEFENEMPNHAQGLAYEADEVARCIRDGKRESEVMSLDESIVIMKVMDEVRRQGGLKYPEKLETLEYPIEHW